MNQTVNRGWLLDQIMLIGHYEASLTHDDEQFCNIDNEMEENSGELSVIEKIGDELHFRTELARMHYQARVEAESDIFTAYPDVDRKKWCDVKHAAAEFTLAAEIYHARNFDAMAHKNLVLAGKALAYLISHTFGFEPMNCLRCFNDALAAKMGGNTSSSEPLQEMKEESVSHSTTEEKPNRLRYEELPPQI